MRISTWFHLAALCLIAGSFQATASARMTPAIPEPKTPLFHHEFTGIGKTEAKARHNALERACEWIGEESGLGWTPDTQYLLDRALVRFGDAEDKDFGEPVDTMKVVKMQLDITAQQASEIQKQTQQQRMKVRQKTSLLIVLGVVCLLGVVGGYLRLEEATKGYFTRRLRLAAVGVVLLVVAALCLIA